MTSVSADTVLVVGATGDVGSQVAREFAQAGRPLRAMVRSPDRTIAGTDGLPIESVTRRELLDRHLTV